MSLSFENRIAVYYMIATAVIMAIVFSSIFVTVKSTVLNHLDNDLSYEAKKHAGEIQIVGDSIHFINKSEWEEREHREMQVYPVFIQLIDEQGRLMDKSPNLKLDQLPFDKSEFGGHFDALIDNKTVRQVQLPIERDGQIKGYILAAISSEASISVIIKLRNILVATYFIILLGLYFVSKFLAGRSIMPIKEMIKTITRITKNNLNERVSLPQNKDEIYTLSTSFNALLERIEKAIEKEKQFTSDASHELRTPLASLRGTLEVLIRKPRTHEEYQEKINFSLKEIDRMTATLEQLLMLARLEISLDNTGFTYTYLPTIIDNSLSHFKTHIKEKNLNVLVNFDRNISAPVPHFYSDIIIDNIVSNAIKYSKTDGNINIDIEKKKNIIVCTISDEGIGIKEEDLINIYDSFYRSDALNHKQISGNGLGLSIAKKCADVINAEIKIKSTYNKGTIVTVTFYV